MRSSTRSNPTANKHSTDSDTHPDKLLRIKAVCELTGIGKTSVYRLPGFPERVVMSPRAVGWRYSQVMNWIKSRPTMSMTRSFN